MTEPATDGRWMKEPPNTGTELVLYWWRLERGAKPRPVYVYPGDYRGRTYGEWWSVPIKEPPK